MQKRESQHVLRYIQGGRGASQVAAECLKEIRGLRNMCEVRRYFTVSAQAHSTDVLPVKPDDVICDNRLLPDQ